MRKLIVFFSFWFSVTIVVAQNTERKLYSIAFYNLENLFDTIHDAGKNDYDFLPDGSYRWTAKKYEAKLHNLSDVLSALSRNLVPEGPAVIGVAEVENHRVLTDLVSQPAMANYKFVHYEGPDRRGIDCALLYDPQQFAVTNSKLVLSAPFEGDTVHLTRGFLIVDGRMAGERVCFIVNHWPSRGAKSPVRVHAARQVKALTDSLMHEDKKLKLFVMGDMNDDPMDESMQTLGARKYISGMKANQFFNPWWEILEDKGVGTLLYRGKWNLFDQIVLSRPLVKAKKGLRYDHSEVFIRDYLIQQDGKYNVFSFVVIDLKAITDDGTNQQTQDSQYCCISEGIPQGQSQILVRDQCFVVFNQIRSRNQFTCNNVNALVCRCTEHIVQWKYRNN